jgi:hypothetical protein
LAAISRASSSLSALGSRGIITGSSRR